MAKISIDLKSNAEGHLPEEEVLVPIPMHATQAFAGALLTIKLLGEAAEKLEVIKTVFSQRTGYDKTQQILTLQLTAIMSDPFDEKDKVEATASVDADGNGNFRSKIIAAELIIEINTIISGHIGSATGLTNRWRLALQSLIKTSDAYLSKP